MTSFHPTYCAIFSDYFAANLPDGDWWLFYCWCLQYESPQRIAVPEDAAVGHMVTSVQACSPDTESPIYYYLIGPSDISLINVTTARTSSLPGRSWHSLEYYVFRCDAARWTRWQTWRGPTTQCIRKFSDQTPVRSYWSRPHNEYSLPYLYWNALSPISAFPKIELHRVLQRVHKKGLPKYNGVVFEIFGKHHWNFYNII